VNIQKIKIENLKAAKYNPRKDLNPEDPEYQKIKKSIIEFGYVAPIIVNSDMTVIGGHQRLKVLKEMNYVDIECVIVDLEKNKEKALNIALNKISGEWDYDKLEELIADLKETDIDLSLTGFDEEELEDVFNIEKNLEDKFDVKKHIEEVKEPITKLGDIWILGEHRLMCGDSTKDDDVKKLMNNKIAKCLFTSPPYNMGADMYENYTDNLESQKYIDFNLQIINVWKKYLKGYLFWNISYNRNSRWEFIEIMHRIIKETGLKFMELIVWDKGHGMPIVSKDMLTRQYEDILMVGDEEEISEEMELYYLGTTEQRGYFNKKKGQGITNYWRITTGNTQLENHKACFPVKLPTRAIELTTDKKDIVLDCFGGSGTTLIACENANRKCYMMELDPRYCDVIIERWEELTGKKAILEK
jgi:DNA modification methylase